jgi:hypothetical protein
VGLSRAQALEAAQGAAATAGLSCAELSYDDAAREIAESAQRAAASAAAAATRRRRQAEVAWQNARLAAYLLRTV